VTATTNGFEPTVMSAGSLVLVLTSIVDTVSLPLLAVRRGADGLAWWWDSWQGNRWFGHALGR
jgi:hypothetical protein